MSERRPGINPKLYHIALVLFCIAIFVLSSIHGEEFPKVGFEFSDKIVHFVIYAILYILFFYSLKNQTKSIKLQKYALEFALLFTMIYGATDEIHQYFVPNRSCELFDWFADSAGGLIMYYFFKFKFNRTKIKATVLISFLLFGLSGCSGSGGTNSVTVEIIQEEAWLDLMPVVGEENDPLGFLISLNVKPSETGDKFEAKDLKIFFNNSTVTGRTFQTEVLHPVKGEAVINVSQINSETYIDKTEVLPLEAQFTFNLYKNNKKLKTIKTSKLTIKKVY